ncbi:hypothetical protein QJQ45_005850 [Haematococcus lacustris]|nr:hypothetical protein QJQ45_005850 [Haematococcus lacustris]
MALTAGRIRFVLFGKQDPYAVVTCGNQHYRSRTCVDGGTKPGMPMLLPGLNLRGTDRQAVQLYSRKNHARGTLHVSLTFTPNVANTPLLASTVKLATPLQQVSAELVVQNGSTPQPAKRTKAEPAAEPTKGKGKGKAAKAKPAPQPGRWLDRDWNAALNMQRIGESRWRPLELCYWPDQGALPAKGKEYPGLGYKRLRE